MNMKNLIYISLILISCTTNNYDKATIIDRYDSITYHSVPYAVPYFDTIDVVRYSDSVRYIDSVRYFFYQNPIDSIIPIYENINLYIIDTLELMKTQYSFNQSIYNRYYNLQEPELEVNPFFGYFEHYNDSISGYFIDNEGNFSKELYVTLFSLDSIRLILHNRNGDIDSFNLKL